MNGIEYELYYHGKLIGVYSSAVKIAEQLLVSNQAVYKAISTRGKIAGEYTVKRRIKEASR